MISIFGNSFEPIITTISMSIIVAIAFPLGALFSIYIKFPTRLKADIGSFSAGIFLAAVTFSIIEEAVKLGNVPSTAVGFATGAVTFSIVRYIIQKNQGDREEEGSSSLQQSEQNRNKTDSSGSNNNSNSSSSDSSGSGQAVIVGTLADSHPETIIIGIILGLDIPGLIPTVLTLFLGNLTATMEGTKRMLSEGKPKSEVLCNWIYVFIAVAIGGPIGYFIAKTLDPDYLSIIVGFAAGALISFVTEELIPEAYKKVEWHIGLSAAFGLFVGFALFHFL